MNLSAKQVENCTGDKRDDRPDRSDDLYLRRRVGFKEGSPAVESFDKVPLDGEVDPCYEDYLTRSDLFRPEAHDFLTNLFNSEQINSLEDASNEIRTDESAIRQACEIHDIEISEGGDDGRDDRSPTELTFPSGESWKLSLLTTPVHEDPRVLTQLLASDGLSVKETARYLSDRLDTNVTESDVRSAAKSYNLL